MFSVGDRVEILFDDREIELALDEPGDIWFGSLATVEEVDEDGAYVSIDGLTNSIIGGPLVVWMTENEIKKVGA